MAVLLSFLDTYVWVCIYKHKFVCVCINNPLQILASMQTYVNALRESGGPGLSRVASLGSPRPGGQDWVPGP